MRGGYGHARASAGRPEGAKQQALHRWAEAAPATEAAGSWGQHRGSEVPWVTMDVIAGPTMGFADRAEEGKIFGSLTTG